MKFGKSDSPENIDFNLPPDHLDTDGMLGKNSGLPTIYIGCAKWNRADLKGFYPRGTKDELAYYSTQFNSIELNATFYSNFAIPTIEGWHEKTSDNFKFFPKVHQGISHWKRLKDAKDATNEYLDGIAHLQDKLGMIFLQLPDNFAPKNWEVLKSYLEAWPKGFPLALELRNAGWYDGSFDTEKLYQTLEENNVTHIITDSAARRDLLHMRLTTPSAFIRYNGANVSSDYTRLDDWADRITKWIKAGIDNIYFFVHQNIEQESPLLSAYLIEKINRDNGTNLKVPQRPS
jgi:uncharacterized protein YecE (DUF72 family)